MWQDITLSDLGTVERGRSRHRPRNDPSLYGGAYPFFQTGDIRAANFWLKHYSATYNEAGLAQSRLWEPGTLCITIAANIAESAILAVPGCFPDSIAGFVPKDGAADASSRKYRFGAGDILFGKIRPYFHKVGIPPVQGICSTDAIVIRPASDRVAGVVLAVVSSAAFVQQAVQTSQGTKMPRANWSVLERYPVPIPSDPRLTAQLNTFVLDTVRFIHVLLLASRNLAITRDLLLPRLISGEIDVSNLATGNAEPAA